MKKNLKITVLTPEFYNYGAMLIAGVIKDAGYHVNLKKGFGKHPDVDILNVDVVLLSLHSTIHLLKYRDEIQKINAFKIVGGPVSQDPKLVLENLAVDLVVLGEGELSILKVLEVLENSKNESKSDFNQNNIVKEDFNPINGIAFKTSSGTLKINTNKTTNPMIRPLPLIPLDISSEDIRGANVYIETHRGCPGNCGFCQVPCFFGREVRSRPLEDILIEVKEFLRRGARKIAISGGTGSLYGSPKFKNVDENAFNNLLMEISKLTGPQNLTIPDIRVDLINDDILESIKKYTNGWVYFGIESGSNRMLRKMKKGITVDDVKNAVEASRRYGLKIAGSFIVGYPGEEEDDFETTVELADELMLDDYFVSIAEPIPGTDLASKVSKLPFEKNALFQRGSRYKNHDFSIAEERALHLMLESYVFRTYPVPMTDKLLKALFEETKLQGDHIRTVTGMIKDG
jgi:tRNA-2-methylthio-N6-dimethylallyladenosine synthase